MGRVIRPVPAGRQRKGWMGELRAAAERAQEAEAGELRDLLAFAEERLSLIEASVESTAAAWEKRQYWVKADRFRQEWRWCGHRRAAIEAALQANDRALDSVALASLLPELQALTPSKQAARERPWSGMGAMDPP